MMREISSNLGVTLTSYRIAIVKSADQVALEAGNSPAIIFRHYRELTTEETAKEWFGIGRLGRQCNQGRSGLRQTWKMCLMECL
jgi:hypothetical protein